MYDKAEVLLLATKFADKVGLLTEMVYGGSEQQLQKQALRRSASSLVRDIQSNMERQVVVEKVREVEGQLQTAAVVGVIGDRDLQTYLGMIDDIYASLDQEN
jgi:hypothetical protein